MRLLTLCVVVLMWIPSASRAQAPAGVPVFKITPIQSTIRFGVKASVPIEGTFKKWDATMTFTSTDPLTGVLDIKIDAASVDTGSGMKDKKLKSKDFFNDATMTFTSTDPLTGVLDIKIDAASVDTGSGMKDKKLKSKDFFNVKEDPYILFHSTKKVQTGADTFELDGNFTIRGVTKDEKLVLKANGVGTGSVTVEGTMAFDRKEYGMNSGIPFIKIADRVEVIVSLKYERISGPPMVLKKF